MSLKNTAYALMISTALLAGCGRDEKTKDILSPDYWLENYRYFKQQKAAIEQVEHTIQNQKHSIEVYKMDFKDLPRAYWPRDARESLENKEFALDGYVRQYNSLVADYNYKASDITRKIADTPLEIKISYKDSVEKYAGYTFKSFN